MHLDVMTQFLVLSLVSEWEAFSWPFICYSYGIFGPMSEKHFVPRSKILLGPDRGGLGVTPPGIVRIAVRNSLRTVIWFNPPHRQDPLLSGDAAVCVPHHHTPAV